MKILGYPSIELFRRGDRMFPITYEGDYTTPGILKFLGDNRVPLSFEELAALKRANEGNENHSSLGNEL